MGGDGSWEGSIWGRGGTLGTEGKVSGNTPGGVGSPKGDEAPNGNGPLGVATTCSRLGIADMVVMGGAPA